MTHLDQTCRWPSQTSSSCTEHCGPHPRPEQTDTHTQIGLVIWIVNCFCQDLNEVRFLMIK